ncbi:MAG: hypothetical protein C0594_13335 [Marinilabiliales bacterium]|nr:MAG: hypothetical protein C0594_13335 [Marinilabiliales bacterium]
MISFTLYQFIGYQLTVATLLVFVFSLTLRLRWVSFAVSFLMAIYGFVILDWYIAGINLILAFVVAVSIVFIHRKKEYFRLLEVSNSNKYLHEFIQFYFKEINKTVPYYSFNPDENTMSHILLRNMVVVGVFIAKKKDAKTLVIDLDFVIPEFRDYRMGKHIFYQNQKYFYDKGFKEFHVVSLNKHNDVYLKKMGFREDHSTGERIFVRKIECNENGK